MLIVAGVECSSSRYFADWLCGCSLDRGVQDSKQLAECVMFLESQLSPEVQAKGWQAQLFTQAKDAWIDPSKANQLVSLLYAQSKSSMRLKASAAR